MNFRTLSRSLGLAALVLCLPFVISAASPVVARGEQGLLITIDDINADAQRLPPGARAQAMALPDVVQQAAQNIYVRRVLAAEALRANLDKDPAVAATLQLTRERVLSDARLAAIDAANKPSEAAIEAAARAAYNAEPTKFTSREQTRVRHILIQGNTDKGLAAAEKVLADLKAGADFEKLAKEKSADPGSAERGGDLGWFEPGKMLPEFEDAAAQLKTPGELSGLVRTQYGWHIIKLEGRRPGGQRTFDEVRADLRAQAVNQLQSDARLREARRIVESFKPDRSAIEAFATTHK